MNPRERAWNDIHSWLPDGWRVTAPWWDPGRQRWEVVARSPKPVGRLSRPDYLIGDGEDELEGLTDVALMNGRRSSRRGEQRTGSCDTSGG